jgi:AAA+ superfamily predicted ATPase
MTSIMDPTLSDTFTQRSSQPYQNQFMSYGMGFGNIQSLMQTQILSTIHSNMDKIKTGNPFLDTLIMTMIQTCIISSIAFIFTQFKTIINWFKDSSKWILTKIPIYLYLIYRKFKKERKLIYKRRVIPLVTENKTINELYKPVHWYLTSGINSIQQIGSSYHTEPYLNFFYDKKISVETQSEIKQSFSIQKSLGKDKSKEIIYKDHKFEFSLGTEVFTMYTNEGEKKKENFIITLFAFVDECEQNDIFDDFCKYCVIQYLESLTSKIWKQQIFRHKDSKWIGTPSENSRKLETIILRAGLKSEIKSDLDLFLNSEDWYKDRDIPYTRGFLFYGHPGTGKTSMIKGMSLHCKRHIHYINLSEINSDSELMELMDPKNINYKETILVIEDIDATIEAVKSRDIDPSESKQSTDPQNSSTIMASQIASQIATQMVTQFVTQSVHPQIPQIPTQSKNYSGKISLSGLLNALDGVFTCHGRILIMTTNHPEVLDRALIRPGRIDSKYLFDNCDKQQIKEMYQVYFNKPAHPEHVELIQDRLYSPAHIASVFLRYRNYPDHALLNLDTKETSILIPK